MDVRTQQFLILNGIILFIIVIYFWRRRPSSNLKRQAKFKLAGANEPADSAGETQQIENASSYASRAEKSFKPQRTQSSNSVGVVSGGGEQSPAFDISSFAETHDELASEEATPINVIFTWNGHAWDAFEVLGIPAGSSMPEVIKAYDEALKKVDPQSQEFIKKAYECINAKLKRAS